MALTAARGPELVRTPAGHAATFAETEQRLAPLIARVPITRIYDATALDGLGLPVWGAVTPLARDLTVHAGKGTSAQAARISAVMEAIERVSAEAVDSQPVRRATFAALRREGALDPADFDLPFETRYRPDEPISWVAGWELNGEMPVWVARDLVVSPPTEGVCTGVETNGLAAGNTVTEAVVHALLELIERDALAHRRFLELYGDLDAMPPARMVDPATLPELADHAWRGLEARGLVVRVEDLRHDLGVPVFRARLGDRGFPGAEGTLSWFEGLGCDLDPVNALMRALGEAGQSHTVLFVGARDRIEGGPQSAQAGGEGLVRRLLARHAQVPFAAAEPPPPELGARLRVLLERLRAKGLRRCVAVELTRADLGVPVVRVLVPGLAAPYGESRRRPPDRLLRLLS